MDDGGLIKVLASAEDRYPSTGGVVAEALVKGSRITGTQRQELGARLAQRYADGESIRAIADDTGRSFGFVHGLIKEAGVPVRPRGGATRGAAARKTTPEAPAETLDQPAPAGTGKEPKDLKAKRAKGAEPKPDKRAKAKRPDKSDDAKKGKKSKKR
jgi:hypothetical protein